MALIPPLLLLLLLFAPVLPLTETLFVRPLEAESYRECLRSGSLLPLTTSRSLGSLSRGGWMVLAWVIPTGGRLVLEPASYPVKVESLRPLLGIVPAAGCNNPRQLL